MKVCTKCKEEKPLDQFWRSKGHIGGVYCQCKTCARAADNKRHVDNRDQRNALTAKCALMRRYGITPEERDALFAKGCAYCGSHVRLHVDHDHETGRVRGALCQIHNHAFGHFGDDIEGLERAIAYLRGDL